MKCNLVAIGLAGLLALTYGSRADDVVKGHDDEHVVVKPADLKWEQAPPALPAGAQVALLVGNPRKAGSSYVMRVKLPDGFKVPPHWHPVDENVTVIKGTFFIGRGEKFNVDKMEEMPAGSYMRMPKEMRHYAMTKGETILQVHGTGPFEINYVNAADDPRKK